MAEKKSKEKKKKVRRDYPNEKFHPEGWKPPLKKD